MLRKKVVGGQALPSVGPVRGMDVAKMATVIVTSESPEHPVENAFDGRPAPGGSRWVAGEPGDQAVTLAFDAPQTIARVGVEIEETEMARTQELCLSASSDGGKNYRELRRQEFNFSPLGTTVEREDWAVGLEGVTHLRLLIRPDKGGKSCQATLTSLCIG